MCNVESGQGYEQPSNHGARDESSAGRRESWGPGQRRRYIEDGCRRDYSSCGGRNGRRTGVDIRRQSVSSVWRGLVVNVGLALFGWNTVSVEGHLRSVGRIENGSRMGYRSDTGMGRWSYDGERGHFGAELEE